jgi:hypothetical protein
LYDALVKRWIAQQLMPHAWGPEPRGAGPRQATPGLYQHQQPQDLESQVLLAKAFAQALGGTVVEDEEPDSAWPQSRTS